MKLSKIIALVVSVLSLTAFSKTIALWPLDYTESGFDGRNCIEGSPALNLYGTAIEMDERAFNGAFPPNPDRSVDLSERPVNGNSCDLAANYGSGFYTKDASLLSKINRSSEAFTVEGWMKLRTFPEINKFVVLYHGESGNDNRWFFTIRNSAAEVLTFQIYVGADKILTEIDDALKETLLNNWCHVALVYRKSDAEESNKPTFCLYINSELKVRLQVNSPGTDAVNEFQIGGRPTNTNTIDAQWDYCRISDEALEPGEFLCDEGVAVNIPEKKQNTSTVAYWKFDQTADGKLNLTDEIRGAKFTHCAYSNIVGFTASNVKAFEDNPPNQVLPNPNNGSIVNNGNISVMKIKDFGGYLSLDKDFSVETYLAPHRMTAAAYPQFLFDTRTYGNGTYGWLLGIRNDNKGTRFYVYDGKHSGDQIVSGDISSWHDEFKHIALVYDCDGGEFGFGVYRFYLDGTLAGAVTNTVQPLAADDHILDIGGSLTPDRGFQGYIDTLRICSAALAPNQFMCATENAQPVAEDNIVALLPFDVSEEKLMGDEYYIDVRNDAANGVSYFVKRGENVGASRTPSINTIEKPEAILNPEPSIFYTNDSTKVNASVKFGDSNVARKYLITYDNEVVKTLKSDEFTIEGYFYHARALNDAWSIMANPIMYSNNMIFIGAFWGLSYRNQDNGNKGYNVAFPGDRYFNDYLAEGASRDEGIAANEWRHVALVCKKKDSNSDEDLYKNNNTMTLYVNGIKHGVISNANANATWGTSTHHTYMCGLAIGGRPTGDQSIGSISSLRISNKALEAHELLCAQGVTPPPVVSDDKATVSYWKLDAASESEIDVSNSVDTAYNFVKDENAPVGSSADNAVKSVPNPDKTVGFIGNARANAGSLVFNGASLLPVQYLGSKLDLYRADAGFTVEGWLKWTNDGSKKDETIVQVSGFASSSSYWRLSLDNTLDTPRLKVSAASPDAGMALYINDVFDFDASALKDVWNHIALVYSAHEGNGKWTLIVNKKDEYTIENQYKVRDYIDTALFSLGGNRSGVDGFNGSLDLWRVSTGCLTADEILFDTPKGTLFIVR